MKQKQAFITGASSDIGIAVSRKYLENGYTVIGHYNKGQKAFFELAKEFTDFKPFQLNLEDTAALEKTMAEQTETFTKNDVLINGAALLESIPFSQVSAEDILRALRINLIPGILFMRTIAPTMVDRGWGRIVHLSSIGVKFGGGSASFCYALSKHAQEFMPSDYKAWAARDVFVNALRIGVTDTRIHRNDPTKDMSARINLIPAKRMASPAEVAEIVYWYGSGNNTFTTGQTITFSGGE